MFSEETKATFALDFNKLLVPTPPFLSTTGSGGTGTRSDSIAIANYRSRSVISSLFKSFGDAPGGTREELREVQISVGGEVMLQNLLALRAGYFYESPSKGDRKFVTVGAGLNFEHFNVNFSYLIPSGHDASRSPLENTLRTSVIFNFDK